MDRIPRFRLFFLHRNLLYLRDQGLRTGIHIHVNIRDPDLFQLVLEQYLHGFLQFGRQRFYHGLLVIIHIITGDMQQFALLIPGRYIEPEPGASPFAVVYSLSSLAHQDRSCQLVGQLFIVDKFDPGAPVL